MLRGALCGLLLILVGDPIFLNIVFFVARNLVVVLLAVCHYLSSPLLAFKDVMQLF